MKPQLEIDGERSVWKQIFLESKVNGAPYRGEMLTRNYIPWPKSTWLKERTKRVRSGDPIRNDDAS